VASSVQWHKCYGTLRPRGNTKKPKTPDEMISRTQLKDSDYSDNGSGVTVSDGSLRCHRPKPEKHQMTSRQDYASAKRLKVDSFDYVDLPWITNLLLKILVKKLMKNSIHPLEP
jgi:hypothetical protein